MRRPASVGGVRTLEWVDWFNNRRLLESISNVPPAEYELEYHRLNDAQAMAA